MKRTKVECKKCKKLISKSNIKKHEESCDGILKEKIETCPHCGLYLSTIENPKNRGNHVRWCDKNPKRYEYDYSKAINCMNKKRKELGYDNMYTKARKFGLKRKMSEETKNKIREAHLGKKLSEEHKEKTKQGRIKYLKENPNSHPWKKKEKFISIPCEYLKQKLKEQDINFIEEFQPLEDRFFSIDVFLPEYGIGIEVNGNQHYSDISNEILKDYYQKRHDLIEEIGIILIELHYKKVSKPLKEILPL